MRLGLTQQLRTEQRLVQSPQMIQAMQVLQVPMAELRDQIEQELQENVFLEVQDRDERSGEDGGGEPDRSGEERSSEELGREDHSGDERGDGATSDSPEGEEAALWSELDRLERRTEGSGSGRVRGSDEEADRRLDALYNTPDNAGSLADHLLEQVRMLDDVSNELYRVIEHAVFSLDADGRLAETAEQIAETLLVPIPLAERAIAIVRDLDPGGVGACDLRDCLLLQLGRMSYVRPLTRTIVADHLDDLALNKLPKIAKATGASIDDVKDSWAFLRDHLNPHPGAAFTPSRNSTVIPDVVVEEVDGKFEVRTERGSVPELTISSSYRNILQQARSDPKIHEYLRRKIEAAKWFIEAVHQRQNTIQRIATEIVRRQDGFLREGWQALKPMKMQDVADEVGVHISTVSRALSGKYIQTPQGVMEMKRFFSGGTVTDSGELVSQQAVKLRLQAIVDAEDKHSPLSDDQLVDALSANGVKIARRTVTKYRKALGIESSSRRREF